MRGLIEAGALGEKTGAGFFRREDGEILAYDLETGEYRPRRRWSRRRWSWRAARRTSRARLALLVAAEDRAGEFLRRLIGSGLDYAARVGPEIADSAAAVDRAMRWGFTWELGPYETAEALRAAGREAPEVPFADAGDAGSRRGPDRSTSPPCGRRRMAACRATPPARWWSCRTASSRWSCTPSST